MAANPLSDLSAIASQIARHKAAITSLAKERDALVIESLAEGCSEREVALAAGVSGVRVHQIKEGKQVKTNTPCVHHPWGHWRTITKDYKNGTRKTGDVWCLECSTLIGHRCEEGHPRGDLCVKCVACAGFIPVSPLSFINEKGRVFDTTRYDEPGVAEAYLAELRSR